MPLKGLGLGWGGVAVVVEWVVERVGMGSCTGGRGWGESGGKVGPWALWEGVAVAVGGCAKGGQAAGAGSDQTAASFLGAAGAAGAS